MKEEEKKKLLKKLGIKDFTLKGRNAVLAITAIIKFYKIATSITSKQDPLAKSGRFNSFLEKVKDKEKAETLKENIELLKKSAKSNDRNIKSKAEKLEAKLLELILAVYSEQPELAKEYQDLFKDNITFDDLAIIESTKNEAGFSCIDILSPDIDDSVISASDIDNIIYYVAIEKENMLSKPVSDFFVSTRRQNKESKTGKQ